MGEDNEKAAAQRQELQQSLAGLISDDSELDDTIAEYLIAMLVEDEDTDDEAAREILAAYLPGLEDNPALASLDIRELRERLNKEAPENHSLEEQEDEGQEEEEGGEGDLGQQQQGDAAAYLYGLDEQEEDDVMFLVQLVSGIPEDLIRFVYVIRCVKSSRSKAGEILVENASVEGVAQLRKEKERYEAELIAKEEARRQDQEAMKRAIVDRFADEIVAGSGAPSSSSSIQPHLIWNEGPINKVRYRDGQVVSTKGEKYIVQNLTAEWDGGSRGKIKTKGKRGPGFR